MGFDGEFVLTLRITEDSHPAIDFHVKTEIYRKNKDGFNSDSLFERKEMCKHSSLRTIIDSQLKSARERIVSIIAEEMDP